MSTPPLGTVVSVRGSVVDIRFDEHLPPIHSVLRAGAVTADQSKNVIHAPPVVPDYQDSFNYTTVVPQPYAQLNFSSRLAAVALPG